MAKSRSKNARQQAIFVCLGVSSSARAGRGPGCEFASDRAIPPPSQAGVGFGLWLGSPVWFCSSIGQREIKLRRNQGPTAGGVFFLCWNLRNPPQNPAPKSLRRSLLECFLPQKPGGGVRSKTTPFGHGTRFEIFFGGYGYVTTQDGTSRPESRGLRRLEIERSAHGHCSAPSHPCRALG